MSELPDAVPQPIHKVRIKRLSKKERRQRKKSAKENAAKNEGKKKGGRKDKRSAKKSSRKKKKRSIKREKTVVEPQRKETMESPLMVINVALELALIGDEELMDFLGDEETQKQFADEKEEHLVSSIRTALERRHSPLNVRTMMVWRLATALPRVLRGDRGKLLGVSVATFDMLNEWLLTNSPEACLTHESQYQAILHSRRQIAYMLERYKLLQKTLKNASWRSAPTADGIHRSTNHRKAWQELKKSIYESNETEFKRELEEIKKSRKKRSGPQREPLAIAQAREDLGKDRAAEARKLQAQMDSEKRTFRFG